MLTTRRMPTAPASVAVVHEAPGLASCSAGDRSPPTPEDVLAVETPLPPEGPEHPIPDPERLPVVDVEVHVMVVVEPGRWLPRYERPQAHTRVIDQRDEVLVQQHRDHPGHRNGQEEQGRRHDALVGE
jgi:hypothetical protein